MRNRISKKTGEIFPTESIENTIRDENENKVGHFLIVKDLSYDKVRNFEFAQMQDRLHGLVQIARKNRTDVNQQVKELLKLATDVLNLKTGILSSKKGLTETVEHWYNVDMLSKGFREEPFNSIVHPEVELLAITDISTLADKKKQFFKFNGISTFIGKPIIVNGQHYGTLGFFNLEVRKRPFSDYDKQMVFLVGEWLEGMLELHEANKDVQKKKNHLEQVLATSNQLNSIIGNDLNSPLNTIIGLSDVIQFSLKDAGENLKRTIGENVQLIQEVSQSISKTVNNMFNWSRLQSGELNVKRNAEDIDLLVRDVTRELNAAVRNKNLQMQVENEVKEPVYLDRQIVQTILRNLLARSIQCAQSDSQILLKTQNGERSFNASIIYKGEAVSPKEKNIIEGKNGTELADNLNNTQSNLWVMKLTIELIKLHSSTMVIREISKNNHEFQLVIPIKE